MKRQRLRRIFLRLRKYIFKRPSITEWILLLIVIIMILAKSNVLDYLTKSGLERKMIYKTDELDLKVIEGQKPRTEE